MADKELRQPTHRAYSVIKREGQDDYWLNIGLVFPHKDNGGFNIMLQALCVPKTQIRTYWWCSPPTSA